MLEFENTLSTHLEFPMCIDVVHDVVTIASFPCRLLRKAINISYTLPTRIFQNSPSDSKTPIATQTKDDRA